MLAWVMNMGFAGSPAGTITTSGDRRIYWQWNARLARYYVLVGALISALGDKWHS